MNDKSVPRSGVLMAICLLLGGVFGLAGTYSSWWFLQLLSLAGLTVCVQGASSQIRFRTAAWLGYAFGLSWFCSSLWWLYISMHVYGFMPAWMAALGVVALSAGLALFPTLALGLWGYVSSATRQPVSRAFAFAVLWMFNEWLREHVLTGFPWNATAYAHVDNALAGYATIFGVCGVSFAAALVAAASGAIIHHILLREYRVKAHILPAMIMILIIVYSFGQVLKLPQWTKPNADALRVALIQGNVPQDVKFESEGIKRGIEQHLKMISEAEGDLIITPETVIPVPEGRLPEDMLISLSDSLRSKEAAALVGIVLTTAQGGYTNSALGFNLGVRQDDESALRIPKGGYSKTNPRAPAQYRYDKQHLVPFGEFIPWGFRWFVDLMKIPLGDFTRGPVNAPSFEVKGERIAPTICYEDVFGDELRARFVNETNAPTIIANMSNLAWFGDTFALDQHLAIARMRSIEFARPTVRATNTGATAVIDHEGKVTHTLPRMNAGTLNASVLGRTGLTPYARFGNAGFLLLSALFIAWLVYQARKPAK